MPPPKHPAPFSDVVMQEVANILIEVGLPLRARILDPFAGIGRIHQLRLHNWSTHGIEIEPEWAQQSPHTEVGNALRLDRRFGAGHFDAVVTSPTYGNRMADHHDARDGSHRRSYTHYMGRRLNAENSGLLQWGVGYRVFHELAWEQVRYALRPSAGKQRGWFVLNISDHIRNHEMVPVTDWHIKTLECLGFHLMTSVPVATPRYRYGADNTKARVDKEWILLFQSPRPR